MSLTGKEQKVNEQGEEKDAFVVHFTNGALQQLEELTSFFEKEDKLETLEMAISFLQLVKNREKESKSNYDSWCRCRSCRY